MGDKKLNSALVNWDARGAVNDTSVMANVQSYLQNTYGSDLNNEEWQTFLSMMVLTNTNPFLGEIYAIKYGSKAQIFIGRNGYRKIALSNDKYDGHSVGAVYEGDKHYYIPSSSEVIHEPNYKQRGKLVGAYFVGWRKGVSRPIYHFVNLEEYYSGQLKDINKGYADEKNYKMKKNAKGEWYKSGPTTWDDKPVTMITKVAESQGLRMMLPEMFSGTYSEEERWENKEEEKPEVVVMISKDDIKTIQTQWSELAKMSEWDTKEKNNKKANTYEKLFKKKSTKDLTQDESEKIKNILAQKIKNQKVEKETPKEETIQNRPTTTGNKIAAAPSVDQIKMLEDLWESYFELNKIEGSKKHTAQVDVYGSLCKKYSLAKLSSEDVDIVIDYLDKEIENNQAKDEQKTPQQENGEDVIIEDIPFDEI